jgi:transposase
MYVKHCKLTRYQQSRLIEFFVAGVTARTAANVLDIHRNSTIRFYHKLRVKIAFKQHNRARQFSGKIEVDESYFGGKRKGKRGRGAAGKTIVFGVLKRGGKVYTMPV